MGIGTADSTGTTEGTYRTGATAPSTERPRRRSPGRLRLALLAGGIAVIVLLAGYTVYSLETTPPATLVVYTYDSLLGGSCGANTTAFEPFEAAYHVSLRFECPALGLASTLIAQKNAPVADLVVGLDEITGPQAEAAGVLVPYAPPGLANVSPGLLAGISTDHTVTPYEWGYLGIDSCPAFQASTGGANGHFSFPTVAANATWARNLIVEDPVIDPTGTEFLVWEIQFYEQVMHQGWTSFWTHVAPLMTNASSWSDAYYNDFTCQPRSPGMVVSYLTDPAADASLSPPVSISSSVSWWNGTAYGWKTIYGVGIVRGSPHLALDEAFVNFMLGGPLQSQLPTTEWEYPANTTVALPAIYADVPNWSMVHPLNAGVTPSQMAADLPGWLDTWQATVSPNG
ncbi:MAG: hypothetical protein ACYDFT_01415 [Thermoplasmata archaeon]